MISVLAALTVAVAVWRTLVACSRIERSAAYARSRAAAAGPAVGASRRIGVVVPLLLEQERLPGLVDHFDALAARLDLELHLVTSEREGRGAGSTFQMCRELATAKDYVRHHHCTDAQAIMAHQLNVAVESPGAPSLLIVYNADSRPSPDSLRFAAAQLGSGEVPVSQQYGAYLANVEKNRGGSGWILTAAAFWQTRWSVAFEMPRAVENLEPGRLANLRARTLGRRLDQLPRMNYVVGHGLAVDRAYLRRLGGFTTRWDNEDAALGLHIALAGDPVVPNPYLELADSPDTVRGLVIQKAVWWGGPARAPSYLRGRTPVERSRPAGRRWTLWMTAALFNHALCWITGPTVLTVFLVALPVAPVEAVMSIAAIWLFIALPNDLAARRLSAHGIGRPAAAARGAAAVGGLAMYLLHGLSAWFGLVRLLIRPLVPSIGKPKTPMGRTRREGSLV